MADDVGTLFVCAVPIGNLEDASPRLKHVLAQVDVIACEDTRTTRRLLGLLDVTPVPRLLAHHDHNERASAAGIVALLEQGQDVALVSDAGTPAVSDPGSELVAAAHAARIPVRAVPGASAVATAVSCSGARMPDAGYRFCGFLPRSERDVRALLDRYAADLIAVFESPRRVGQSLAWIAAHQPQRIVTVCRELSKLHEQIERGPATELAEMFADDVRGELVLVLDPMTPSGDGGGDGAALLPAEAVVALVLDLAEEGVGLKRASKLVAARIGGSARGLYEAALAARSSQDT